MAVSSQRSRTTVLQNVTIGGNSTKCSVARSVLFLMTACKLTIMSITFRLKNINEKIKSQQESEQSI